MSQITTTVPVNTRRRDWWRILRDLMAAGVSMSVVASKCNRDPSTVQKWSEGSEPKESDARVVLALYAKHCPIKYREHQRHYSIRLEIQRVTGAHETFPLPFVDDSDE